MSDASEKPLSLTRYPISISVCSPFIKYLRSDARNPASDIYYLISGHQVICVNAHAAECDAFSFKEVIQPQVPLRLPCYDFTPVINPTFGACPLAVGDSDFWLSQLPWCDGRCVQGPGTYSQRHADSRLLAIPTSWSRVADSNPDYDRLCGISSPLRVGNPLYRPL